jgi:hypothetical protein
MRGDMVKLLLSEAKTRPDIAALVDRVENLTDAEIEAIKVPLPWFRTALRRLRAQRGATTLAAYIEQHVVDTLAPDPEGWLHIWKGGAEFLPLGRGTAMDVQDGEPLFLPDTGGFWLATAFAPDIPHSLLLGSLRARRETKGGYMTARRDWIAARVGSGYGANDSAGEGRQEPVRFFRPG